MLTKIKQLKPAVIVGYILAVALGVLASFIIFTVTQPEPWKPLGPYPEQTIIPREHTNRVFSESQENVKLPAIDITDKDLTVSGSKCSKENVKVLGSYGWRSNSPAGFVHEVPQGPPGQRIEGCQSFTFENVIPPEVKAWALEAIESGKQPEIYLSGCEIPVGDSGEQGEKVCWHTEPFAFVK